MHNQNPEEFLLEQHELNSQGSGNRPWRLKSQYDANNLAKISKKGLQFESRALVSQGQTNSLRQVESAHSDKPTVAIARVLGTIANLYRNLWQDLLFVRPGKSMAQCRNYGHLIHASWEGMYPKCFDCGATVTDPSQLRSAYLKKVPEQPLFNNERKYVS